MAYCAIHKALISRPYSPPPIDTLFEKGCGHVLPGTFVNAQERQRLIGFPDAMPTWDLMTDFTRTEPDHPFIKSPRSDAHRLGVALQLCTLRYRGFCPTVLHAAPMETVAHLAEQRPVNPSALQD
jgi:hypothetical protein